MNYFFTRQTSFLSREHIRLWSTNIRTCCKQQRRKESVCRPSRNNYIFLNSVINSENTFLLFIECLLGVNFISSYIVYFQHLQTICMIMFKRVCSVQPMFIRNCSDSWTIKALNQTLYHVADFCMNVWKQYFCKYVTVSTTILCLEPNLGWSKRGDCIETVEIQWIELYIYVLICHYFWVCNAINILNFRWLKYISEAADVNKNKEDKAGKVVIRDEHLSETPEITSTTIADNCMKIDARVWVYRCFLFGLSCVSALLDTRDNL